MKVNIFKYPKVKHHHKYLTGALNHENNFKQQGASCVDVHIMDR